MAKLAREPRFGSNLDGQCGAFISLCFDFDCCGEAATKKSPTFLPLSFVLYPLVFFIVWIKPPFPPFLAHQTPSSIRGLPDFPLFPSWRSVISTILAVLWFNLLQELDV
ncbi:hypothetical protein SDJN03_05228, partial [Cucurbita argyrosperma subsp. sororia]